MLTTSKVHVAVVGAGPSGLSACRHLIADHEHFTFVCYEQCDGIGGTWYHAADPQEWESNAEPTSVAGQRPFTAYDSLRCNLTVDVMEFPDFKFLPEHVTEKPVDDFGVRRHFAIHYDILNYLKKYADKFGLWPHICLNEQIVSVDKVSSGTIVDESPKYQLRSRNTVSGIQSVERFDAVLVCNGHYAKPNWPKSTKHFLNFTGGVMHCKYYRGPDKEPLLTAKKIVVLGQSASGPDIAVDIVRRAPSAKEVVLAGRNPFLAEKPENVLKKGLPTVVRVKPDVEEVVGPNSVRFSDDSVEHDVDLLIAGTGFDYYFPFLSNDLALRCDDKRLQPLYKHVVHINHRRLCFIGLHHLGMGFQIFDTQVRYVLAMLRRDFELPSRADMLQWEANDYVLRTKAPVNWPHRYAHRLQILTKAYHDELVAEADLKPLDDKLFHKFLCLCWEIGKNPESFREADYPE